MMQDPREFQEIESMGEDFSQEAPPEEVKSGGGVGFLIFQAAVCVLLLFGLVFLKASDQERYRQVRSWYQQELDREIELPRWEGRQESAPAEDAAASLLMV